MHYSLGVRYLAMASDFESHKPQHDSPEGYVVVGRFADGPLGPVYRAQRASDSREVAIVFVEGEDRRTCALSPERLAVLASLDHDGIAQVLDGGVDQDGNHYVASELAGGLGIVEYSDQQRLTLEQRVSLMRLVCDVVQHAHQKGVFHGHLHPGTVRIVDTEATPRLKITGFEFAGVVGALQTLAPEYLSPEQAWRTPGEIDARSDVYALGALLYQLLCGEGPLPRSMLREASRDQVLEVLREYDPPEPSRRFEAEGAPWAVHNNRQVGSAKAFVRQLQGDLDWIAAKSMAVDPSRRYASVDGLSMDLLRFLAHEPVLAAPPGTPYPWGKVIWRNRKLVATAAFLLVVLTSVVIVLAVQAGRMSQAARDTADQTLADAQRESGQLRHSLAAAVAEVDGLRTESRQLRGEVERQRGEMRAALAELAERRDGVRREREEVDAMRARYDQLLAELDRGQVNEQGITDRLEARLGAFELLEHFVTLNDVREAEGLLYPAGREQVQAMEHWLERDWRPLEQAIPEIRRAVDNLEARATPATVGAGGGMDFSSSRGPWQFSDRADQYLHASLNQLLTSLETMAAHEVAAVERRLSWARCVDQLTVDRHHRRWEVAQRAISAANGVTASKLYAAWPIELQPQSGLVPIGMNPRTKLWEFYHLRSAWDPASGDDPSELSIPVHRPDGTLLFEEGRGIVFVLLPGGILQMGAQARAPDAPNYDPHAEGIEGPVHALRVAPFFLARWEVTADQWSRLSGDPISANSESSHPAVELSWERCDEVLRRQHGLALPTEAQWELGCRGGTATPWWSGAQPASLRGVANLRDQASLAAGVTWGKAEAFDDGYAQCAPVGSLRPNAFGLFDVHGNVWEWCRDRFASYTAPARGGDGLRLGPPADKHVVARGGGFTDSAVQSRAAVRYQLTPASRSNFLGVRCAREIDGK